MHRLTPRTGPAVGIYTLHISHCKTRIISNVYAVQGSSPELPTIGGVALGEPVIQLKR